MDSSIPPTLSPGNADDSKPISKPPANSDAKVETEDDDNLTLPTDTLAHLQAFLNERREREERFQALASQAERDHAARTTETSDSTDSTDPSAPTETADVSIDLFEEDWQMSQFWYDEPTQRALAEELSFADFNYCTSPPSQSSPGSPEPKPIKVAIVSAPSVFVHLLSLQRKGIIPNHIHPTLLEFDTRFSILAPPNSISPNQARFVEYDFNNPLQLPADLAGTFDSVLVDPPFLSAECQAGAAVTARWLLKPVPAGISEQDLKDGVGRRVVVCTGETVSGLIERYYGKEGVRETTWVVKHERDLSNPFVCLASYEGRRWNWIPIAGAKS